MKTKNHATVATGTFSSLQDLQHFTPWKRFDLPMVNLYSYLQR